MSSLFFFSVACFQRHFVNYTMSNGRIVVNVDLRTMWQGTVYSISMEGLEEPVSGLSMN
jgi:hypothetical protein